MNKKVNPFSIAIIVYCILLDTAMTIYMGVTNFLNDMALSYILEMTLVFLLAFMCISANKPLKRTEKGRFATKVAIIAVDAISIHVILATLIYLYFTKYLTGFILIMLILALPIIMCIIARKKLDEAIFRKEVLVFAIVMIALGVLVPVFFFTVAGDLIAVDMAIPYFQYFCAISYVSMIVPAALLLSVRYIKM